MESNHNLLYVSSMNLLWFVHPFKSYKCKRDQFLMSVIFIGFIHSLHLHSMVLFQSLITYVPYTIYTYCYDLQINVPHVLLGKSRIYSLVWKYNEIANTFELEMKRYAYGDF